MIQQSLAYSQRKLYLEKIYVPPMFTAALFTVAKYGNNLNVCQ